MRRTLALARTDGSPAPGTSALVASGTGAPGAGDSGEWVATVALTGTDLDGPAWLYVHGVATAYDVVVNGEVALAATSMFARSSTDVTALLRVGDNEVRVRCHPLEPLLDTAPRRPRARWRTWLVEDARLRWVRTTVLGRAPGFAPGPALVGPYRPVVLETGAGARIAELILRPTLVDGTGVLDVEVAAIGAERVTVVLGTGAHAHAAEIQLVGGRGSARIEVPGVAPWWPHTHGTPALHEVRVLADGQALDLPGDATGADPTVRRVGFRALGNGSAAGRPETATDSVDLHVNGVRVFVRGAVWTPGDLGALDEAVRMGLNLVRVSGVASYESDAFHERCDELGLLVWQDLMFATFDYPLADADFAALVDAEVADQAGRLLAHPSTVVVCGSAEHEQQAAMFGVNPATGSAAELAAYLRARVEAVGPDALWVDSSPSGGALPIRVDTGVAQYFGVGAYLRPLPDARTVGVRFAAECLAFAHLADPPVEGGVPQDVGAAWDFADVREHYARERYGEAATLEQRQRVTGEVMADVFGEWRRPMSSCGGGIVLWLRDVMPGSGWGLLDHAGRPKPCVAALAPVLQPVAVWLVDEGLNGVDAHVANDTPDPLDATLVVELLRADGSVLDTAKRDVHLAAHAHAAWGVEELLGRFADAAYAYRFGPPAHARVRAVLTGAFGERAAVFTVSTGPS